MRSYAEVLEGSFWLPNKQCCRPDDHNARITAEKQYSYEVEELMIWLIFMRN